MKTDGGADAKVKGLSAPPRMAASSSRTILMTCWAGLRLDLLPQRLLPDPSFEIPDDLVVDVRLEESQPDHLQGFAHVLLGDLPLAPEELHHLFEAARKLVKHRRLSSLSCSSSTS